jgi:hypothetical protein
MQRRGKKRNENRKVEGRGGMQRFSDNFHGLKQQKKISNSLKLPPFLDSQILEKYEKFA